MNSINNLYYPCIILVNNKQYKILSLQISLHILSIVIVLFFSGLEVGACFELVNGIVVDVGFSLTNIIKENPDIVDICLMVLNSYHDQPIKIYSLG